MKGIIDFFDKFEDNVRSHLSNYPIVYTFIGGIAIVLFWRGVWNTADYLQGMGGILGILFSPFVNMILVIIVLLATGLFVSYFIGDAIILSGAKSQKKLAEKTSKEIREEETTITDIKEVIDTIKEEVDEIKREVELKQ